MIRLLTPLLCILLSGTSLMTMAEGHSLFIRSRESVSLNGEWKIIVDPYENGYYNYRQEPFDQMNQPWATGYFGDKKPESSADLIEYDYDLSPSLHVPGDWNTQDSMFLFYEGTIWYRKKFDAPFQAQGKKVFVHFGGVNYRADVYLNGKKLGYHVGGFTPFYFEITDRLKEKDNSLVVKVDNKRLKEGVPTLNTDWWNYGGITRDVKLIMVPQHYVIDYTISLESVSNSLLQGEVFLSGISNSEKVNIAIPELRLNKSFIIPENKTVPFQFTAKNILFWSPENPKLYRIEITTGNDILIDSVGFRTIKTKGKQILLNDQPIFLRGISIHEEYSAAGRGRVKDAQEAKQLLEWSRELGCNFVRLAHYPHNEEMIRLADKMGILVWSEIPVYWTIDFSNEATYQNAQNQLEENILRDRNRASIIIWSMANETPVSEARNHFLRRLIERTKQLDNSRLISAAMEKLYESDSVAVINDPIADLVDVVSFNQYIGWYDGLPEKCERVSWKIPYEKPVIVSEFGGDAKFGLHGGKENRWTEEYQEDLYIKTLKMLDKMEGLCGLSPWILVDFRSPRRPLPGVQDYYNRKGLLSEKGEKKKAYFVLRKYYEQKNPN
jgi:beta-glucuronidase